MKNIHILYVLGLTVLAWQSAHAQGTYPAQLSAALKMLDTAKVSGSFVKAAGSFEQLAHSEKKDWLAYYYAGLADVLAAFQGKGKEVDALCDRADRLIAKADSLKGNTSEMEVLRSMSASARISVNVLARGKKYGGAAMAHAELAIKANPENPRAYLQKATALYYTPEVFGGGTKKAKPVFETALEKYKAFKTPSVNFPHWGRGRAQQLLKEITTKEITTIKK